eukprot:153171_1
MQTETVDLEISSEEKKIDRDNVDDEQICLVQTMFFCMGLESMLFTITLFVSNTFCNLALLIIFVMFECIWVSGRYWICAMLFDSDSVADKYIMFRSICNISNIIIGIIGISDHNITLIVVSYGIMCILFAMDLFCFMFAALNNVLPWGKSLLCYVAIHWLTLANGGQKVWMSAASNDENCKTYCRAMVPVAVCIWFLSVLGCFMTVVILVVKGITENTETKHKDDYKATGDLFRRRCEPSDIKKCTSDINKCVRGMCNKVTCHWIERNTSYIASSLANIDNENDHYLPINFGSIIVLIASTADLTTDLLYAFTANFANKQLFILCWLFISLQVIPQIIIGIIAIIYMLREKELVPSIVTKLCWDYYTMKYFSIQKLFIDHRATLQKLQQVTTFKLKDLMKTFIWIILWIFIIIIMFVLTLVGGILFVLVNVVILLFFIIWIVIITPMWISLISVIYIIASITKLVSIENVQIFISNLLVKSSETNDNSNDNDNNNNENNNDNNDNDNNNDSNNNDNANQNRTTTNANDSDNSTNWKTKIKIKQNVFNGLILIELILESFPQR